ncbi:hypothetical protein VVD49_19435 [Uliginosibacterium sp. H3]|uniref:Uncharacterized protein n=1 Tax=Uliginosibacterium silvisoli TaxID=3114758 RepID=A0ABU6KAE8_9RHOO|nr:hypothetical protein [Uliginosibacterium sp. H3]
MTNVMMKSVGGWARPLLLSVALSACAAIANPAQDRIQAGKALFDEKCRTVAGQKIYRTVEDVEGIVLLKLRPRATESNLADPMWPGAAFAKERDGEGYITSFLSYEHSSSPDRKPVAPNDRGYITTDFQPGNPSNIAGYRYVDVADERDVGKRWRYSGLERMTPTVNHISMGGDGQTYMVKRYVLDKAPAPSESPRYGVTFEDHVDYAERGLGLASSTVKVIDLKTQEVLGEFTRYAWTPASPNPLNPTPWLSAYNCGDQFTSAASTKTRLFVDQILKPLQDR